MPGTAPVITPAPPTALDCRMPEPAKTNVPALLIVRVLVAAVASAKRRVFSVVAAVPTVVATLWTTFRLTVGAVPWAAMEDVYAE